MARRYKTSDFQPSDEELAAARTVGEGGQKSASVGHAIGTAAGGAIGALGFVGGPALGAATLGAGAGIGQLLGSLAGSALAEEELQGAEATLQDGATERQRAIESLRARRAALAALMTEGR